MPEPPPDGLAPGPDGAPRCFWGVSAPEYVPYHDTEWGFPTADEHRLFEQLCLECFQSGLSWITILRKRPAFREAFAGFDPEVVARYGAADVERLLGDASIVRNRAKVEATINNAGRLVELVEEVGSLAAYVWSFEPPAEERPGRFDWPTVAATTTVPSATAMAKDLKRRGWRFIGPTTSYAFMQSAGLVNDHLDGCTVRTAARDARRRFKPPTPPTPPTPAAPPPSPN